MNILKRNYRYLDFPLILTLVFIAIFSCIALLAATYGKTSQEVPSHIVVKQISYEAIGFLVMGFVTMLDYRVLQQIRWKLYGFSIFLLIIVFAMPRRFGAHSWVSLGLFSFQPSEFAKMTLIIVVASYMANLEDKEFSYNKFTSALSIFGMFIFPFLLTLKEPALGQALVMIAVVFVMYIIFAKRSMFLFLMVILISIVGFISIVAIYYPTQSTDFIQNVLIRHHILKAYQAGRIITWLNPNYDLSGAGYNAHEAQIAVGSGQLFGEGLFQGIQTNLDSIPNQWTDFIFTSIAEEFGFVGSSILILLFLFFFYRLIKIALSTQDVFGSYIIMGCIGMFAFQVFENIGMNMYLSPITGITLPFVSYGGTSLITNYIAVGIALSISIRRKPLSFHSSSLTKSSF